MRLRQLHTMAPKMASFHFLSHSRQLWSLICGQTTCRPSRYGTQKITQYHIILDWEKYTGIDLIWDYNKGTYRDTMDRYIQQLRPKYAHQNPNKPQLSTHAHRPIDYGSNTKKATTEDTNKPLETKGIKQVQGILGSLQYIARAVNNKLIVALSTIGTQQATATANKNT